MNKHYYFRLAEAADGAEAAEIETICFPPNEACRPEDMMQRVRCAGDCFLLLIDGTAEGNGTMIGFLNGLATKESVFRDEFFTDASLHDPDGKNVMLLGLDVRPEYREQGLAGELLREFRRIQTQAGREKLILTCHDRLVSFYEGHGYRDLGLSGSVWGGEVWHDMVCEL